MRSQLGVAPGCPLAPPRVPAAAEQPRPREPLGGSVLETEHCLFLLLLLFSDKYQDAHKRGRIPCCDKFLPCARDVHLKDIPCCCLVACYAGLQAPRAASAFFVLQRFKDYLLSLETCIRREPFVSKRNGNQKKLTQRSRFHPAHLQKHSLGYADPTGGRRALCLRSVQVKVGGMSAHVC